MTRTSFPLLKTIVIQCRQSWLATGNLITDRTAIEQVYPDEKSLGGATLDEVLTQLSAQGLITYDEYTVRTTIPFSVISTLFDQGEGENEFRAIISATFDGDMDILLEFLTENNLIVGCGPDMRLSIQVDKNLHDLILDEILTYIDHQDATQIRYGLYDTRVRGSDVLKGVTLPNDPFLLKAEFGLRELMDKRYLLPLKLGSDIQTWEFRSRIGEIVRLLERLRQRFPNQEIRDAPRLTSAVKLEVVDRRLPRRYIPIEQPTDEVLEQARFQLSKSEETIGDIYQRFVSALKDNGFDLLRDYQYRSFLRVADQLIGSNEKAQGMILTAGTGMGKTLAYMAPLLLYILATPERVGTKAINIYPRIKLAENQIKSFVRILYALNRQNPEHKITIGIDYSGTPYKRKTFGEEVSEENLASNRPVLKEGHTSREWKYHLIYNAYICPYAKCPVCGRDLYLKRSNDYYNTKPALECLDSRCTSTDGPVKIDFIEYSKEDIASNPPDILICTTESLNARLSSSRYQHLFGSEKFCTPKLIMIDEVHLHTSLKGSQVAWLIRRLIGRIEMARRDHDRMAGAPLVLGLSATIGQPVTFFHELTGIPEYLIKNEFPLDEELEKSGAEYFIFVKPDRGQPTAVLSTLIQTCMCVQHNMQRKIYEEDGQQHITRYKTLGFVDSLDLVKRWQHDLADAEKRQLYTLHDPRRIAGDERKNGNTASRQVGCQGCTKTVDESCVRFQQGECWWFMRYGVPNSGVEGIQDEKLKVFLHTSQEKNIEEGYDLLVTTSSMEVGYDDPDIMCVIQYLSPMNIASFTQRKGRAGRSVRNRPITLAVLSPYKTKDLFYYRNHHSLIEPGFEKPPMNPENQKIRTIHGFYAALDYLAYNSRNTLPINGNEDFPYRLHDTQVPLVRGALDDPELGRYLHHIFGELDERNERIPIYDLINTYCQRVEVMHYPYAQTVTRFLPDELPASLFSSINLPSVNIQATYSNQGNSFNTSYEKKQSLERDLEINHALITTTVGNPQYRWQGAAYWIPPFTSGPRQGSELQRIGIDNSMNWVVKTDTIPATIPVKWIPESLKSLVPNVTSKNPLVVIRPQAIQMARFPLGAESQSRWIYCDKTERVYFGIGRENYLNDHPLGPDNHRHETITERSQSYPISFYEVSFDKGGLREDERFSHLEPGDLKSQFEQGRYFGPFHGLVGGLYFANNDSDEEIYVTKAIIGARCGLRTSKSHITRIYAYSWNRGDAGLGFEMQTDGINLTCSRPLLESIPKSVRSDRHLYEDLLRAIFKFEVFLDNQNNEARNSFAIDAFLEVYLNIIARRIFNLEQLQEYYQDPSTQKNVLTEVERVLLEYECYNDRTKEAVLELWQDTTFVANVVDLHLRVLNKTDPNLIEARIQDIFIHSLKHALKSASIILGGFESERDLGGYTYLSYDFNTQRQIYIFEHGIGGTGAIKSIYQTFRDHPEVFWNFIESSIASCPTGDNEAFLIQLLRLPRKELEGLAGRVHQIEEQRDSNSRQIAIHSLIEWFLIKYGFECNEEDIRLIMRLFAPSLDNDGTITNWLLSYELNIVLADALRKEYGREPSIQELKMVCFTLSRGDGVNTAVPTWRHFINTLKDQEVANYHHYIQHISTELENSPLLRKYIENQNKTTLHQLYNATEEEQMEDVYRVLNLDKLHSSEGIISELMEESDQELVSRIVSAIFATFADEPVYTIYLALLSTEQSIPSDLRDRIMRGSSKKAFFEEVEKRLLNTCVDGCPSCLHTSCDIDGDPLRNKLLLSRRLLGKVLIQLKDDHTISAAGLSEEDLERLVRERLLEQYQVYITYKSIESQTVATTITQLMGTPSRVGMKQYSILVNSSGYRTISFDGDSLEYEICLRCREVTQ